MTRTLKIQYATTILLTGFVACLLENIYLFQQGLVDNIFMFIISKNGMFDDFTNLSQYAKNNDPYALMIGAASPFPFHFRISWLFALLPKALALVLYFGGFLTVFTRYVRTETKTGDWLEDLKNLLLFSFCSYPFLFSMNRGNYEIFVFLAVALFVKAYGENRRKTAFAMLTLALALKPFPVVFLALYFADRRYKEMVAIPVLAALITLVSYASFNEGMTRNLTLHLRILDLYNQEYAIGNGGMTYGHSLFGFAKALIAYFRPAELQAGATALFGIYGKIMVVWAGLTGLYVAFVEKELWRRIALLVFMMNLFPFVSADYKLMYVYIPLFLLINRREYTRSDAWFLVLLALLLVPKSYHYFKFAEPAQVVPYVVTSASLLNPLLMLVGYFGLVGLGLTEWVRRRRAPQAA